MFPATAPDLEQLSTAQQRLVVQLLFDVICGQRQIGSSADQCDLLDADGHPPDHDAASRHERFVVHDLLVIAGMALAADDTQAEIAHVLSLDGWQGSCRELLIAARHLAR